MSRIENLIKNCDVCQKEKLVKIRPKEEPVISDTSISDIIGPMTKTKRGNQFVLSIHNELTKYLMLVPLKTKKSESIINALLNHYIYIILYNYIIIIIININNLIIMFIITDIIII